MALGGVFAPGPRTPAQGLVRKSQERVAPGSGVLSARRRQGLPPPAAIVSAHPAAAADGQRRGALPRHPAGATGPRPRLLGHLACHLPRGWALTYRVNCLQTGEGRRLACKRLHANRRLFATVQYVTCHVLHGDNADALPNVARHCRRGLASTQHFLIPAPFNPETSVQAHLPGDCREDGRASEHRAGQIEGEEPSPGARRIQRGPARPEGRGTAGGAHRPPA